MSIHVCEKRAMVRSCQVVPSGWSATRKLDRSFRDGSDELQVLAAVEVRAGLCLIFTRNPSPPPLSDGYEFVTCHGHITSLCPPKISQ